MLNLDEILNSKDTKFEEEKTDVTSTSFHSLKISKETFTKDELDYETEDFQHNTVKKAYKRYIITLKPSFGLYKGQKLYIIKDDLDEFIFDGKMWTRLDKNNELGISFWLKLGKERTRITEIPYIHVFGHNLQSEILIEYFEKNISLDFEKLPKTFSELVKQHQESRLIYFNFINCPKLTLLIPKKLNFTELEFILNEEYGKVEFEPNMLLYKQLFSKYTCSSLKKDDSNTFELSINFFDGPKSSVKVHPEMTMKDFDILLKNTFNIHKESYLHILKINHGCLVKESKKDLVFDKTKRYSPRLSDMESDKYYDMEYLYQNYDFYSTKIKDHGYVNGSLVNIFNVTGPTILIGYGYYKERAYIDVNPSWSIETLCKLLGNNYSKLPYRFTRFKGNLYQNLENINSVQDIIDILKKDNSLIPCFDHPHLK